MTFIRAEAGIEASGLGRGWKSALTASGHRRCRRPSPGERGMARRGHADEGAPPAGSRKSDRTGIAASRLALRGREAGVPSAPAAAPVGRRRGGSRPPCAPWSSCPSAPPPPGRAASGARPQRRSVSACTKQSGRARPSQTKPTPCAVVPLHRARHPIAFALYLLTRALRQQRGVDALLWSMLMMRTACNPFGRPAHERMDARAFVGGAIAGGLQAGYVHHDVAPCSPSATMNP